MKTGKAILGILAGLTAGAVLGVLYSSVKGSKGKRKISKKGEDLANALSDTIDEKFSALLKTMAEKNKSE